MIGEKWLSNVLFTTVKSKADISKVRKGANGDFQPGELSRAVNTEETNDLTVGAWLARAKDRKATIVFCVDIAHVVSLTNHFRRHGIDARFVTGDTPKIDRGQRLDAFKAGEFPVLINCGVFTEGTDIPNIDCVLLARPTKSRNLLVQMIGRGMRLHPGKANCHVLDMVASLSTGVVTTPTLFGLDPSDMVDEADVGSLKDLRAAREAEKQKREMDSSPARVQEAGAGPSRRTITFTDYDSVQDLIEDTSGERHIRAISSLAWVEVAHAKYVLSTQAGDFLTIEQMGDDDFKVRLTARILGEQPRGSPFMRPRELARTQTFLDAVHAADTYASDAFPRHFITKDQAWRRGPASQGQVDFLNKLRPSNDQLGPEGITKGKAGDMITKIRHGARGRFEKIEATKKRHQRERSRAEYEDSLRRREDVRVGPLVD